MKPLDLKALELAGMILCAIVDLAIIAAAVFLYLHTGHGAWMTLLLIVVWSYGLFLPRDYQKAIKQIDEYKEKEAIRDTLLAVMEGVNRYVDFADCCVTPRELNAVWDALQGKTFEEIGDKFHVTPQSARLIWAKGLRKFAHVKAAFYHIQSDNDDLRRTLKEKNVEIANLKAQLNDKQIKVDEDTQNMSRLLAARLDNFGLSARTMNCMRYAEIDTLRDLLKHHRADMLKYRNFGKKSLCELDELLEDHGLRWGMDVDLYPVYVPEVVA